MTPGRRRRRRDRARVWAGAVAGRVRESRAMVTLTALAAGFAAMTAVILRPEMRAVDARVSRGLQRYRRKQLLPAARFLTELGNGPALTVLSVPVAAWAWRTRRPWAAALLFAAIGGHLLNRGIKSLTLRPRPNLEDRVEIMLPSTGSSFPSGHAMTAVMYFGFLGFLIHAYVPSPGVRLAGVGATSGTALAICWSRVYVGAHFLSDILGGIAAGGFFLVSWAAFYRRIAVHELLPAEQRTARRSASLSTIV